MKRKILLVSTLLLSISNSGWSASDMDLADRAFDELDMETGSCKPQLQAQAAQLNELKASLEGKSTLIAQLKSDLTDLESSLQKATQAQSASSLACQQNLTPLETTNNQLKAENAALKAEIAALGSQLAKAQQHSQTHQETPAPKAAPKTTLKEPSTRPKAIPPVASSSSSSIKTSVFNFSRSNNQVSVTFKILNTSAATIFGMIIGDYPTLVDDQGNRFTTKAPGMISNIERCYSGDVFSQVIESDWDYCTEQVTAGNLKMSRIPPGSSLLSSITFDLEQGAPGMITSTADVTFNLLMSHNKTFKLMPVHLSAINIKKR